jgi:hypothetical protein
MARLLIGRAERFTFDNRQDRTILPAGGPIKMFRGAAAAPSAGELPARLPRCAEMR